MEPVLFYTIGLPGAGKTTFASRLSNWLTVTHLRGDKIGLELFRFPTYSPQERQMVYAEMGRRAAESLQNSKHVLYDAAVNSRAQREQLANFARQHGGRAVGIWIQTPVPVAKKRAGTARDSGIAGSVVRVIPPHIFDQYAAAFETPTNETSIITIAGDAQFMLQYRRLQRQLPHLFKTLPRIVQ
jgi:predicted kinase